MKLMYNVVCVHIVYTTYMQAMDLDDLRQIGDDFSGVTLLMNIFNLIMIALMYM